MKKSKLLFEVDRNNHAKVYIGKKWLHDVKEINIHGVPYQYDVLVTRHKRDNHGKYIIENGNLVEYTTKYTIGGKT